MNLFVVRTWLIARFTNSERGASMVEYILLVALIALAVIAAVVFLRGQLERKVQRRGQQGQSVINRGADTIEGLRTVIRGPSVASGARKRGGPRCRLASPPMMPWTHDRQVHVGDGRRRCVGGGALLARSWVIVATTDHVLRARSPRVRRGQPPARRRVAHRLGPDAARKPRRLARRRRCHVAGQSRPAVDAGGLDRESDRVLGGEGREAGRQPRAAQRCCCPTSSCASTPAGSATSPDHSAVAFGLATALAPSLPRPARPAVYAAAATVAFGRIYGSAHLPLDVAGGIGVGLLGARSPDGRSASAAPASRLADRRR